MTGRTALRAFGPFRDPSFRRLFLGSASVLAVLAFIACRITWYQVPASALVGSYHRASTVFLPLAGLPEKMELRADGVMELFTAEGDTVYAGPWRWDDKERVVRTDAPRWDRQVRMRSTLLGPRLCLRVCPDPFIEDEEEHDEEVPLVKDALVTENTGHGPEAPTP
jgi:hypothetical protein